VCAIVKFGPKTLARGTFLPHDRYSRSPCWRLSYGVFLRRVLARLGASITLCWSIEQFFGSQIWQKKAPARVLTGMASCEKVLEIVAGRLHEFGAPVDEQVAGTVRGELDTLEFTLPIEIRGFDLARLQLTQFGNGDGRDATIGDKV